MTIIWNTAAQGTLEWKDARRGAITGSRAKLARDRSDGLTDQQRAYVNAIKDGASDAAAMEAAGYKKRPTAEAADKAIAGTLVMQWGAAAQAYAMDCARERCGGSVLDIYQNAEMRIGVEHEPSGRMFYEDQTGYMVELAGFAHTEDGKFGCSVDGLIDDDGVFENKVMVSSSTLFKAVVFGDISEYRDQCLFEMWLLRRQWCDLTLYVYDMPELSMVIRIERNEEEIQALEDDMVAFDKLVSSYETKLRARLNPAAAPPWEPTDAAPAAPVTTRPAAALLEEPQF